MYFLCIFLIDAEYMYYTLICIINYTYLITHPSTIREVISTLMYTSTVSNSMSNSECYFGCMSTRKSTVAALIIRGLKCVIN